MDVRRKISHILLLLSLPALMYLYYNQTANWHYHVLSNGIVVEHAHPFSNRTLPGSPFQEHQHSDLEYSYLAEISNVLVLLISLLALAGFLMGSIPLRPKRAAVVFIPASCDCWHRLRGPPSFSFSSFIAA